MHKGPQGPNYKNRDKQEVATEKPKNKHINRKHRQQINRSNRGKWSENHVPLNSGLSSVENDSANWIHRRSWRRKAEEARGATTRRKERNSPKCVWATRRCVGGGWRSDDHRWMQEMPANPLMRSVSCKDE